MAMVIVATIIIAALAVACGWIGSHQHLGFTVTSRRYGLSICKNLNLTVEALGECVVPFGLF